MPNIIPRLLFATLITLSINSHATVIVTNDYLNTNISALAAESYDEVDILESHSLSYIGAAKNLSDSLTVNHMGYAYVSQKFSVGTDITNQAGGGLASTLFSGYILTEDQPRSGDAEASAFINTNWTFTTTQDIAYNLRLVGEFGGKVSYSLFDEVSKVVISEGSELGVSPNVTGSHGMLESFHTYTISMMIDRKDGKTYGYSGRMGDGTSSFSFSIDDVFDLSPDRTHNPVPEPYALLLFVTGIAIISFVRKGVKQA